MAIMENMVVLPAGPGWRDSGEGGLAFYLLIPENDNLECNVAGVFFAEQDVIVYPRNLKDPFPLTIGVLIGSTSLALVNENGYFHPTFDDLTSRGKYLFRTLEWSYRETPIIVTLLDT